jgi:hypothetical protein
MFSNPRTERRPLLERANQVAVADRLVAATRAADLAAKRRELVARERAAASAAISRHAADAGDAAFTACSVVGRGAVAATRYRDAKKSHP